MDQIGSNQKNNVGMKVFKLFFAPRDSVDWKNILYILLQFCFL